MTKLRFKTVVAAIASALAVLILVQAYWIKKTFFLKQHDLHQAASEVLKQAIKEVEDDAFCFNFRAHAYFKPGESLFVARRKWDTQPGGQTNTADSIEMFNLFRGRKDSVFVNFKSLEFDFPITVDMDLKFEYQLADSVAANHPDFIANDRGYTKQNYLDKLNDKRNAVQMIDTTLLDSLVHEYLVAKTQYFGLFSLGIKEITTDTFEYVKSGSDKAALKNSNIKLPILERRKTRQQYEAILSLDDSTSMVMQSMWLMLITSGIIILALTALFAYFIQLTLKQKHYSDMKNDFINNMTHEFKTPVTNISLAIENIALNKKKSEKYMGIIHSESEHLKENVERILQIAALEKQDINLHNTSIDIHRVLEKAAASFEAQLNRIQGRIHFNFRAAKPYIMADEFHLKNVFCNLFDNAIKYCNQIPEIQVYTEDSNNGIRIVVADNGLGIDKKAGRDIFKRFYRINNQDIHNIKGVGLGLSYVKHIVSLYKGQINVESEPGFGSTFIIELNH